MSLLKEVDISGRDYYKSLYSSELDQEAEWLRRGAENKVDSIQTLLKSRSISPQTILELGCGTGAVICECRRRAVASRYIAVDYSPDAIGYLRSHAPEIEAIQADITAPGFSMPDPVDVVYLTHVIEHLDDPDAFLRGALRNLKFKYLIAEVPLEDLAAGKLKNLVRDRRVNVSGHVQFFTATSFERLLKAHGLKIIDRCRYVPFHSLETIRFLKEKDQLSPLGVSRMIASSVLTRALYPFWARLYYSHYAVLCSRTD
jgi:SAM-dependent methyltransferase